LRVNGKVAPEIAKPLPETDAALMISGTLPDEVRVSDCVVAVFSWVVPKLRDAELRVRAGVAAFSCRAVLADAPFAVAVMVTLCAVGTATAVAVKGAVVAPAGTVIESGTATALLLLERLTVSPLPGARADSVTVQLSVAAPVSEPVAHATVLGTTGSCPVPLRPIVAVPPVVALLVMVSAPVAAPAVVGSKVTTSVDDCPGFRVTGRLVPDQTKAVPLTAALLMTSGALPVEVTARVWLTGVFTSDVPKAIVVALRLMDGVLPGPIWRVKVAERVPDVAVMVTVCAEETASIVAVKVALWELRGTVSLDGNWTALLLLFSATVRFRMVWSDVPNFTVHASVPAPVIVDPVQERLSRLVG
jgi:hypothetical protein